MTDSGRPAAEARITLQRLTLPDPAICTETDLYVHLEEGAFLRLGADEIAFLTGGRAWFDTYMNMLSLASWGRHCRLSGLWLRLAGEGRFHLKIWRTLRADMQGETLLEDLVDLSPEGTVIDLGARLGAWLAEGDGGIVAFRLAAMGPGRLTGGAFLTGVPDGGLRPLRLAVSITTFRREAAVAATAARVTAFLDGEGAEPMAAAGAEVRLFVVDNGQSATLPPHPRLTVIPNANLGGAGGFARGLAAAQDAGFTHCLFMDDDASFQMENLLRTAAFLQLARSPRAALAGAMISAVRPWMMWENGAVFDRLCRPLHVGTDLRSTPAVVRMEFAASRPKPPGFYGGWWYFAFAIDQVRHYPFPFFVRGDDISFSLAHRFDTATLPGVVSFQEDFSAKESALTLYLDLRNHLHQHLVHEGMEIGATGTARIVLRFLIRSLVRMHYDSAEAQLTAWEDVMKGPEFFAENADMTARRPAIQALIRTEAWRPATPGDLAVPEMSFHEPSLRYGRRMLMLLNGHLVPLWRLLGRSRRIPISHRGLIWPLWGLKEAVFISADESRAYRVRHDKARAFRLLARAFGLFLRWRRAYPALRRAHRAGYEQLAARSFWQSRFLSSPAGD